MQHDYAWLPARHFFGGNWNFCSHLYLGYCLWNCRVTSYLRSHVQIQLTCHILEFQHLGVSSTGLLGSEVVFLIPWRFNMLEAIKYLEVRVTGLNVVKRTATTGKIWKNWSRISGAGSTKRNSLQMLWFLFALWVLARDVEQRADLLDEPEVRSKHGTTWNNVEQRGTTWKGWEDMTIVTRYEKYDKTWQEMRRYEK